MADEATTGGALSGLRVLDLGLLVQGPQAGQLLSDLGADVIKVELPGLGDQARWIPLSFSDFRAPYFIGCNRGKRSLTLDLRREKGQEIFLRLVETADVVLSNFLPGTLERWNLGYEQLAARNPRIVFGSGSAFGSVGAGASRKGADLAGQAEGGLIRTTGRDDSEATPVGVTIADHIGSQNLSNGVLAALLARERTGRGQKVEVSLVGGQIFAQASELTSYFLTGEEPARAQRGHPLIHMIYGIFPTQDGYIGVVGVVPDKREAFFATIGRPDLWEDERFRAPLFTPELKAELFDKLADTFRQNTTDHWAELLHAAEQRYARVRGYREIAADEEMYENGYLQRVDHPEWGTLPMIGSPIRLSETPARPGQLAPELGQHTEEVLLEIGFSWEDISSFREAEIL